MRRRLFKLIFFSVLVTVVLIESLSYLFLKTETEKIIDEHIEKLAASLISSDLSEEYLSQFEITDDEMQDILGGPRINHIVAIYNHTGERIYANYTAVTLGVSFDNEMAWQSRELGGHHVRYLVISTRGLVVQVGLVMDEFRHRWVALSNRLLVYGVIMIGLGLLLAWFLTKKIMNPLKDLTAYLFYLKRQLDSNVAITSLNPNDLETLQKMVKINENNPDEWTDLVKSLEMFLMSVKVFSENGALRASLLTHELKTPLTIIQNTLEQMVPQLRSDPQSLGMISKISSELQHLTKLINDFLSWSLIVSQLHEVTDLYALHLKEEVQNLVFKFNSTHHHRIQLEISNGDEDVVFAQPLHLNMLLSNLISNALKYSPETEKIKITLEGLELKIKDCGGGISSKVQERIGSPFNIDHTKKRGRGLGLALVSIITKKYNWDWQIKTGAQGTTVTLRFAVN